MAKQAPNHFVNPAEKGEKWILKMVKHIWDEWESLDIKSFAKGKDRYRKNRSYSLGKQSNSDYIAQFLKNNNPKFSYTNIKFEVLPIIPKFRRITNEKIGKIEYTIKADAIDPLAMKDRVDYENTEKARIKTRDEIAKIGYDTSMLDTGEKGQPKTFDELAMRMEFEYKHNHAMDVEKRIAAAFASNHIDEQRPRLRWDLFDYGAAGLRDYFDPNTGEVKVRAVDIPNFVVSTCKDEYFRDALFMGEITHSTIEDIKRTADATGSHITDDNLQLIADKNRGMFGNPNHWGDDDVYNKGYDSFRVPVLDLEFKSVDRYVYEKRRNKRGNLTVGKTKWHNQFKKQSQFEYFNEDRIVWYRAKWIIGTDIIFDYGLVPDMKRKNSKLWDAQSNFHVVAPELHDMETSAPVEQIIPFVDNIHRAYYKLQNAIISARPKGLLLEIGAMENISVGDSGETLTPLQISDILDQTGNLWYRSIDMSGDLSHPRPIQELTNGIGTEAQEWFRVILDHINMIKDALGFNEFTDATTPDPRSLNGVASLAADSTNNAINHLFRAEKSLIERVADSVAIRVHDAIAFKKTSFYDNILGSAALKSINENKDSIHREYGIIVEHMSDKSEWEDIKMSTELALKAGQISIADKYKVLGMKHNIKQAQQYLSYVVEKNMKLMREKSAEDMQQNAQVQIQSAQAAEELKQSSIKLEADLKDRNVQVAGEEDRKTLQFKYELEERLRTPEHMLREKEIEQNAVPEQMEQ